MLKEPREKELRKIYDLVTDEALRMAAGWGHVTIPVNEFNGLKRRIEVLEKKNKAQAEAVERLTGRIVAQRKALREQNQELDELKNGL